MNRFWQGLSKSTVQSGGDNAGIWQARSASSWYCLWTRVCLLVPLDGRRVWAVPATAACRV